MAEKGVKYSFGPNGETRVFASQEDLLNFINSSDFLNWIDQVQTTKEGWNNWLSNVKQQAIEGVRYVLQSYGFEQAPHFVEQKMHEYPFPTRGTPAASWIARMARTDPDRAFHALTAILRTSPASGFEQAQGAADYAMFLNKVTPTSVEAIHEKLNELLARLETAFQHARDEDQHRQKVALEFQATLVDQIEDLLEAAKADFSATQGMASERMIKLLLEIRGQAEQAIASITATERAYIERMSLEASVTYWETKAKRHRDHLLGWTGLELRVPLYFGVLIGTAAVYLLLYVLPHLTPGQTERTVGMAALGALGTTVALWYGRIMTRELLHHRRLLEDAEERKVMLMSYVALTKENQVGKEDRVLALGAVFRPSVDSGPSDDGAPDLATATIIGRLVQNK